MPTRTFQVNIDDTTYQTVLNRARQERKPIGQVIGDFLNQYAEGASGGAPTTYTVQRGDTLGRIARTVYGDPYKYPLIQKANNIEVPSRIWVGQVLIIPSLGGGTISTTTSTSPSTSIPPSISISPSTSSSSSTSTPSTGRPSTSTTSRQRLSKPPVQWAPSPNFNSRRRTDDITAITMHATANSTLQGVINWFQNKNAQVSAHYTIGKDGRIAQHVQDQYRAWHAGKSSWKGRSSCNDYCIGIELVNLNNGVDPYPEAQYQANVNLCAYLCAQYNISPNNIMTHREIALPAGRKSDPLNYDMDRLRRDVAAKLRQR